MARQGQRHQASAKRPCIFCQIARGEAPAAFVARSERAVAFLTLGPLRPGHALVIPRAHAVTLDDVSARDWHAVASLAVAVARAQRKRLGAQGITVFLASGRAGEQSVGHLHLHVVPRAESDRLDLTSWWEARVTHPSVEELEATASKLRGHARRRATASGRPAPTRASPGRRRRASRR